MAIADFPRLWQVTLLELMNVTEDILLKLVRSFSWYLLRRF